MRIARARLLVGICAALLLGLSAHAQTPSLPDFEMEDQFGTLHRRADAVGDVVLLIGGDREGGAFSDAWKSALEEALSDHPRKDGVTVLMLADLNGTPRLARRFVRGMFVDDPARPILMDWSGEFADAYDFEKGRANVLVFAPDGSLARHAAAQEVDGVLAADIAAAVRGLLDAASASLSP